MVRSPLDTHAMEALKQQLSHHESSLSANDVFPDLFLTVDRQSIVASEMEEAACDVFKSNW